VRFRAQELQSKNPWWIMFFISMDKAADKWKTGIEKRML
jgi:hypothetical protein